MISFGFLSLDILIILIIFTVLFLTSFKTGKKLLVSLIVSTYPAVLIFNSLTFSKINLGDLTAQAIIFLISYIFIVTIFWRNLHVKKYHNTWRKFLDYFLLSISYIILIISIYINSVSSLSIFYNFSETTINVVSVIPYSISLIIPVIIILLTNRRDLE
jgi:hypothetical protein